MTVAEKAKQAVLERVIVLAKDATVLDLFPLTDTIGKITGKSTKPMNVMAETMSKILERPPFSEPEKEKGKK